MACSVSQFDKRFNSTCIDPDAKRKRKQTGVGGGGEGWRGVRKQEHGKREGGAAICTTVA